MVNEKIPPFIRAGPRFIKMRNRFKAELKPVMGDVSDTKLTDAMAEFIERQNLEAYMINKAKTRFKGPGRIF